MLTFVIASYIRITERGTLLDLYRPADKYTYYHANIMCSWNQFRQEDFIRSYQVIFIVGISTESVCRGKGGGLHHPFVILISEVLPF